MGDVVVYTHLQLCILLEMCDCEAVTVADDLSLLYSFIHPSPIENFGPFDRQRVRQLCAGSFTVESPLSLYIHFVQYLCYLFDFLLFDPNKWIKLLGLLFLLRLLLLLTLLLKLASLMFLIFLYNMLDDTFIRNVCHVGRCIHIY